MIDRSCRIAVPLLMALHLFAIAPAAEARRPTLLQRLRELIGLNPRQAVGGSRGESAKTVCLISPRLNGDTAVVNLPSPTLLAVGDFNEVRLEQRGHILWQQKASSTTPIRGPFGWPLPPLTPGQEVLLRLRPRGASGGDFADIRLRAASANQQQEAIALLGNFATRLRAIEKVAQKGDYGLASELVFAPIENLPVNLAKLRQELLSAGCSN